jgi:hypothetical protein
MAEDNPNPNPDPNPNRNPTPDPNLNPNLTSTPHKAGEVLSSQDSDEESDDMSMPTSKKSRQEPLSPLIGQGKRLKTKEAIKQGKQIKGSAKTVKKKK